MTTTEPKKRATRSEPRSEESTEDHQPSRNQPEHDGEDVSSNADEAQKKQDKDLEEGAENPV